MGPCACDANAGARRGPAARKLTESQRLHPQIQTLESGLMDPHLRISVRSFKVPGLQILNLESASCCSRRRRAHPTKAVRTRYGPRPDEKAAWALHVVSPGRLADDPRP